MAAAAMLLASCEPQIIEGGSAAAPIAASDFTFIVDGQYADAGCVTAQTDGNFVKYHTEPATTVQVFSVKADGSRTLLGTGASGVINVKPKRGSDPNQTLILQAINQDASLVENTVMVTVFVPGELDPELKLLLGDGVKSWTWDNGLVGEAQAFWGNAGNSGAGANFSGPGIVDGKWWGVTSTEEFEGQSAHSAGNVVLDMNVNAYMTLDEDGGITSYGADGTKINKATFEVKNYNASRNDGWALGQLVTSGPAVLFPYSINMNGANCNTFDIMYLDENYMTLVDQKNAVGSWAEITFWLFKNKDGISDILTGGSERTWTWDCGTGADGNPIAFWGNAGSTGGGANFTASNVDGKWWGVTSTEEFEGQSAHSGGSVVPDMNQDAYMVFTSEGKITSYGADGAQIATANYEVTDWDGTRASGWQLGYLETSAPAVLFPYSINMEGATVKKFSIMYADADYLTLVDDKNAPGSWGEITFWKFRAK